MAIFKRESSISSAEKEKSNIEAGDVPDSDIAKLRIEEAEHDIKFRTLSWQKAALLLFGEYVCLAILSLAWSWSVLGWLCGFFVTFGLACLTWYTSYILWQWCMRHPEARDICDIARSLFPGKWGTLAFEVTALMLLLNNIFLIGFHIFTGAKIFNTLSDSGACTVIFQVVTAILGMIVSLPRTLNHVSLMSIVSAASMAIAILLSLIYVGIEDHPGGKYPALEEVYTSVGFPGGQAPGFVNGLNAVLNISFLFIGQILYPSFIAEMEEPEDFPKALALLTGMEMVLFTITAAIGYHYLGQYSSAPVIDALQEPWARKSAFAFVLLPTVLIGAIYSNVAAKFVFNRVLGKTKHVHSHSLVGWGTWIAIVIGIWAIGFVLGNVIPSMGDFLAIMSAAFDSFYGFIYWAVAYWHMNREHLWSGPRKSALSVLNIIIFLLGLFMLGGGLYSSIDAIIVD